MLALERHIAAPLSRQAAFDDAAKFADASALIARIKTTTEAHVEALQARLDALGGHEASGIKSAWASMLGAAAAAIDASRKSRVSKSLRDDYTALALASVSYSMLYTTALGLGDAATAALAKNHLEDSGALVMAIGDAMPSVVLLELADDGVSVAPSAAAQARRDIQETWRKSAQSQN
jgi:ferritin-like metal-binding protein YciE